MLETIVRAAGRELGEFWDELVACAAGPTPSDDRLVARNLATDPRLNDPGFAAGLSAQARADIATLFGQWRASTGAAGGVHAGYAAVSTTGAGEPIGSPAAAYRRLWMLGYDTAGLCASHCGRWVGFLSFRPGAISAAVDNREVGDLYRADPAIVTGSVVGACRRKELLWVACLHSLAATIAACPPAPNGGRVFDPLRDLLGLEWFRARQIVIGVEVTIDAGEPLARVPCFFDSCGYRYFRPATPARLADRTGGTCPIDDPGGEGAAELVVWAGADPPPAHVAAGAGGRGPVGLTLLPDRAGGLALFAVATDFDPDDYVARRG